MKLSNDQFRIIGKKTAYKAEKVQIDTSEISLPNGNVAHWDVVVMPTFYVGLPVKDGNVLMTREWRLGPAGVMTQFSGGRGISDNEEENLGELRRELKEELGLEGGTYEHLVSFSAGVRITGDVVNYIVTDFTLSDTDRDENEIQDIISLPIKGLYNELSNNHVVTADTLLAAKLLEEKYVM